MTLAAQTISVTSPTANQTLIGSFTFKCSVSGMASLYAVNWSIDGEPSGFSTTSPYSLSASTFDVWNGVHKIHAVALDAIGTVLATSPDVTFTTNNTWPYNDSALAGTNFTATWTVAPGTSETSPWSGTVALVGTLGGTYNHAANNPNGGNTRFTLQVDGKLVQQDNLGNVSTDTINLDTTKFPNGTHQVVFNAGVSNKDIYGGYERTITFSNGATAMELRTASNSTTVGKDVFLCVTSATNCPSTVTLTGTIINTDGTTSAATPTFSAAAPSQANNQTPVCAVGSSTGVVTVSASGACVVTMTASGFTDTIWVHVFTSANVFPHFQKDGSISTAQADADSVYASSVFLSDIAGLGVQAPGYSGMTNACYGCDYAAAGWTSFETGGCRNSAGFGTQSGYQTQQAADIAGAVAFASTYGLYIHLINDDIMRGDQALFDTTRGPGASWTPTATAYCWQQWVSQGRAIGVSETDEVNSFFGHRPRNGLPQMGTASGPSSIVVSSNVATVHWTDWNIQNGSNNFIITGATTSAFNSAVGSVYNASDVDANTFTFTTSGVANGTYNSSNNPNLVIQPYVHAWHGSDYNRYDAFINYMAWSNTVTGRPKITWSNAGGTNGEAIFNWESDPNMADYMDCYNPSQGHLDYLSSKQAASGLLLPNLDIDYGLRNQCGGNVNLNAAPILAQTQALVNDYGIGGVPVAVTSCSGDLCTFSAPHGLTQVRPGVTRLSISGSSNSAYNTKFWVRAIISSTVLQLYTNFTSTTTGSGGTLTFADGATFSTIHVLETAPFGPPAKGDLSVGSDPTCSIFRHRGQNATLTGSTNSAMNGVAFYVPLNNPGYGTSSAYTTFCGNFGGYPYINVYAIPSGSTTGGTASVIADNYLHKGTSWHFGTTGAELNYADQWLGVLDGASGSRAYLMGVDLESYDQISGTFNSAGTGANQNFGPSRPDSVQQGFFPLLDPQRANWFAAANANLHINRFVPYLYGQRLASPDYGPMFLTSARANTIGNILIVQSFADGGQTRTINLSPYLESGQNVIKYYVTWNTSTVSIIAAGTATDTENFDQAGTVVYLFPNNFASELSQPSMSVRLADIPNATAWAVRYAFAAYLVDQRSTAFDCGSAASCALPVDRKIGPVYYRIIYRDANGNVLATSDIQTM